jgi:hypothetical protein
MSLVRVEPTKISGTFSAIKALERFPTLYVRQWEFIGEID